MSGILEIIIREPQDNEDPTRGWSYNCGSFGMILPASLKLHGITPATHPRIVDLWAGDGSCARIFVENGWQEPNIVCIDMYRSPTPLVPRAQWRYWDLRKLGYVIPYKEFLPPEVLAFKEQFDIAVSMFSYGRPESENAICELLVRKGGFVMCNENFLGRLV